MNVEKQINLQGIKSEELTPEERQYVLRSLDKMYLLGEINLATYSRLIEEYDTDLAQVFSKLTNFPSQIRNIFENFTYHYQNLKNKA